MLKIFTDSTMSSKEYLADVEAEFNLDEPIIDDMYTDSLSVKILEEMEGMTSRNGKQNLEQFLLWIFLQGAKHCYCVQHETAIALLTLMKWETMQ